MEGNVVFHQLEDGSLCFFKAPFYGSNGIVVLWVHGIQGYLNTGNIACLHFLHNFVSKECKVRQDVYVKVIFFCSPKKFHKMGVHHGLTTAKGNRKHVHLAKLIKHTIEHFRGNVVKLALMGNVAMDTPLVTTASKLYLKGSKLRLILKMLL